MTDLTKEPKQSIIRSLNVMDSQPKAIDRETLNESGKAIFDTFVTFLDKFRALK